MGATSSSTAKSFNETVSENLNNTMISRVRQSTGAVTGTQRVKIQNINCENINIGDITQKMVVTYNFKRVAETFDTNTLKAAMVNAVDQAAKTDSNVKSEFMASPFSGSASTTEVYNKNINRVVNNYSYQDFTNDLNQAQAAQEVGIQNLSGKNCNIGNISQDLYMEMIIENMSKSLTEAFQALQAENQASQKTTATSTTEAKGVFSGLGTLVESVGTMVGNIFSAPILLILGIILFVVMIGMVIKLFSGGGSSDEALAAAMLAQQSAEFEQYEEIPDVNPPVLPSASVTEVGDASAEVQEEDK